MTHPNFTSYFKILGFKGFPTYLQGVMKSISLCWVSWMMTRLSLEMAMNASIWVLVLQSSTTTAQDNAPRKEESGEKRGRIESFFFGANKAERIFFIRQYKAKSSILVVIICIIHSSD